MKTWFSTFNSTYELKHEFRLSAFICVSRVIQAQLEVRVLQVWTDVTGPEGNLEILDFQENKGVMVKWSVTLINKTKR